MHGLKVMERGFVHAGKYYFHEGQCTKYARGALRLQFQLHQLAPAVAQQLKWGRFSLKEMQDTIFPVITQ